jgi:hypothetical protein
LKNSKINLKLSNKIMTEIRKAKKIEIYLIKEISKASKDHKDTFTCSTVFLKTDQDILYTIEGVIEDFGVDRDEVFGISVYEGWREFEIIKKGNNTKVFYGKLIYKVDEIANTKDLFLYDIFTKEEDSFSSIEVNSYKDNLNGLLDVEVDEAILFKRNNQLIYIGQHIFPSTIVITKDEKYIEKLLDGELE